MKRKTGPRYDNGRLKKLTAAERTLREAEAYRSNMQQVGQQPHRRGASDPLDPWLTDEFGRFCRTYKLRREIKEAADEWALIVRLYRVAWGAPVDERHGSRGTGEGPSCATVEGWRRQMQDIEDALYGEHGTNKARYSATKRLVLDGVVPARELLPFALDGLRIVAVELGRMTARDAPFQVAA